MTLQQLLQEKTWLTEDGGKHILIGNIYYLFDEDGELSDVGNFIFKDERTVSIKNTEFSGEFVATEMSSNKIVLDGFIVHFERDEVELVFIAADKNELLPEPDDLVQAALYSNQAAVARFLQQGADINQTDNRGDTALKLAFRYCNVKLARWLLEQGANINFIDRHDETLMHQAIRAGSPELVRLCGEHGLGPDNTNTDKNSIGFCIEKQAGTAVLQALLESNAWVESDDEAGEQAMQASLLCKAMFSFANGIMQPDETTEKVDFLLTHANFDINAVDNMTMRDLDKGNTALMYASANGFANVVRLLLAKGADVNLINYNNETALDVICRDFNQSNQNLADEIRVLLNQAGLVMTKTVRGEQKLAKVLELCEQEQGREAMKLLLELADEIEPKDYDAAYIDTVLTLNRDADEEQLKHALDRLSHRHGYEHISNSEFLYKSIKCFLLLWDMYPQKSDAYEADREWVEYRVIRLIDRMIEREGINEEALLLSLDRLKIYGRNIGINEENADDTTNSANKCALQVYDRLVAMQPKTYLEDKCKFLSDISVDWMDDHFDCFLLAMEHYDENTIEYLESRLQYEYQQRQIWQEEYKKDNPDTAYHRCPVPRDQFIKIKDQYIAKGMRDRAEWYFKEICFDAPSNKSYWSQWFENTILRGEVTRAYDNAMDAVKTFDWNRNFFWRSHSEAHKKCNSMQAAIAEAYDNLCYSTSSYENLFPIFSLAAFGANLDAKNDDGVPYLVKIIQFCTDEDIKILLEKYINEIDAEDVYGRTAFYLYAEMLHQYEYTKSTSRFLLDAGANQNATDQNGETVLFNHIRSGNKDAVEFLINECNVDVRLANKENITPLETAMESGNKEIQNILLNSLRQKH